MNTLLETGLAAGGLLAAAWGIRWYLIRKTHQTFIMGLAAKNWGNQDSALQHFRLSGAAALILMGKKSKLRSDAELLVCWVHIEQGEFAKAFERLAAGEFEFSGLSPLIAKFWLCMAAENSEQRQLDVQTNDQLKADLAAFDSGLSSILPADTLDYASYLYCLGWMRTRQGRVDEAAKMFNQSLLICQRISSPGSIFCAPPMMNLCWISILRGDYQSAIRLVFNAISIYRNALGEGNARFANAVSLRGVLALVLGEHELSMRDLLKARRIYMMQELTHTPKSRALQSAIAYLEAL